MTNEFQVSAEERDRLVRERTEQFLSLCSEDQHNQLKEIPEQYHYMYLCFWHSGKHSPTTAIKLKCLECSNFQITEVKLCDLTNCSLHKYRPYK